MHLSLAMTLMYSVLIAVLIQNYPTDATRNITKSPIESEDRTHFGAAIRTQSGKCRFRNLDPIDDPRKVSALVMLAQQHVTSTLCIPLELQQVIHEYSDYNEIRILFQILTSLEDRKAVLGFESYEQMHQKYPRRSAKILYLNNLRDDAVKFDGNGFVIDVDWTPYTSDHRGADSKSDPKSIHWNAINGLKHLRSLRLRRLALNVSIKDISGLPASLRTLNIAGCVWTEPSGDVDVSLFPPGLERLYGRDSKGMTGVLHLAAPHSNLTELILWNTDIQNVSGVHTVPPLFHSLYLSRKGLRMTQSLTLLEEKGILRNFWWN